MWVVHFIIVKSTCECDRVTAVLCFGVGKLDSYRLESLSYVFRGRKVPCHIRTDSQSPRSVRPSGRKIHVRSHQEPVDTEEVN